MPVQAPFLLWSQIHGVTIVLMFVCQEVPLRVEHHMLVQAPSLLWSHIHGVTIVLMFVCAGTGSLPSVVSDSWRHHCSHVCVSGGPPEGGASCAGTGPLPSVVSDHDVTVSLVDDEEQNQVRAFFSYQEFNFSPLKRCFGSYRNVLYVFYRSGSGSLDPFHWTVL
jgi:hypothetical protein